jgi:tRNA(Ile)-lysidine synthase
MLPVPNSTSLPPSGPTRTARRTPRGVLRVERAVRALEGRGQLVLAVSGGLDSMVLLDACVEHVRRSVVAVATFDHGTGAAAREAAELVRATAASHGLPVVSGRAQRAGRSEAAWRAARWDFLHHTAALLGAAVVTAHTADDQVETVFMRLLRGAGTRGLAGLRAPSAIARPLLGLGRAQLAAYARARGLAWVEDPSNASRVFLRNRVRLDLLPAVERVQPGFREWLLELGERAAAWRARVDALLSAFDPQVRAAGELSVAASRLEGYDAEALGVVWPALAARAGVTLDRRGTRRLAEFTMSGAVGGRVQLSGGFEVVRRRDAFALRRSPAEAPGFTSARPLRGALSMGPWRFRPIDSAEAADPSLKSVM